MPDNDLHKEYMDYLSKLTKVRKISSSDEFALPLFDRRGDQIIVYVEKLATDDYLISDDGYITNDFLDSGLSLTDSRKQLLQTVCRQNGIHFDEDSDELTAASSGSQLVQSIHSFGQALLQIDDLYMTSQSRVSSYFTDDLIKFFDENEIYYSKNVELKGRSGLISSFNFCFQKSKNHPERLCIAINNATKERLQSTMFIWEDVRENRDPGTELFVIINDSNKVFSDFRSALQNYNIRSYNHSDLKECVPDFQ